MAALVGHRISTATRHNTARVLGAVCIIKRNQSNLTSYKRGTGGRSSFSGIVATVFGASGFLGRYVVNKLGKIGSQIIVPYRGDPYHVKNLKLAGDLGQVLFLPYQITDPDTLRQVMKYSNTVINLTGRDWETKNFTFDDIHVKGAERIARIAKEVGVERLIHMSALNASPNPPSIYKNGGSDFLKSKYYGELAVKERFPEATIIRPADVFGPEDRFIRYYANGWRRSRGKLPLWKKGEETIKMPVFCSDVGEGVINVVKDPATAGNTYEFVGPHGYYLADLIDYFYRCMRWPGFKRTYITPFFRMKVFALEQAPVTPIANLDRLEREFVSDVLTDCPTLEDLGVKLTRIEQRAIWELKPWRRHRYYEENVGEFADPEPPPVVI